MMTQVEESYAAVLLEQGRTKEEIAEAEAVLRAYPPLPDVLSNPTIPEQQRFAVIERLFAPPLQNALKVMVRNGRIEQLQTIFDAFYALDRARRKRVHAVVEYVTPLTQQQKDGMIQVVQKKTGQNNVELELVQRPEILGGFILHIGDFEYDRSVRRTLKICGRILYGGDNRGMSTMHASEIISILKSEIDDFDRKTGELETGTVVRVGDGIATVYGMQHAMYGELVEFENGVRGIVQNLEAKTVGVVLLGSDYGIVEGSQVVRSGKRAGIGVGPGLVGRVVDALGKPIDGGAPIEAEDYFRSNGRRRVSQSGSPLPSRCKPVSWQLTQCSRLDGVSVN